MKKIMILVAVIAIAIATQAQSGYRIVVNPAPTVFDLETVTSSDVYNEITLSGSEKGVTYQLYCTEEIDGKKVKTAVGEPVKGTGNSLTFKVDKVGEYTTTGISDKFNGCMIDMNGIISITKTFDPGTLSGKEKSDVSVISEKFNVGILDENTWTGGPAPEKYEFPIRMSDCIIFVVFLTVLGLIIYGIINRKKISLGEYKEMKAPFTGTIRRKK